VNFTLIQYETKAICCDLHSWGSRFALSGWYYVLIIEPTSGMDPVNRRFVWSFIEDFKKKRVVILTTHSMEEAEVVSA
jgi:ABC-type lipoprotein export system ATPase subunit